MMKSLLRSSVATLFNFAPTEIEQAAAAATAAR